MQKTCPFCHRDLGSRKPPRLYGNDVCRSCYWGFALRRHVAFVFDWFLYVILWYVAIISASILLVATDTSENTAIRVLFAMLFGFAVAFLCKDGFAGYSLGKRLFGLRVVHSKTGRPAGFFASFIRNLSLLIPFVPVILAVQLFKGQRACDTTARTLVMWNKYAGAFIFPEVAMEEAPEPASMPIYQEAPSVEDDNPYRPPLA